MLSLLYIHIMISLLTIDSQKWFLRNVQLQLEMSSLYILGVFKLPIIL